METEMNVHTTDLICSFCDLDFTRSFCLKRHLKNVHAHQQGDLNEGILKEFSTFSGRLKEGVSEKKILQDIREEITVDSGRKMLIEKKGYP
ncbi:c2H2-type domain-containing protein [Trichonephila clavata]|uniref:C2H2-type domain-containing protein n=1 Tax=Trichonephila clavata TaxID=2740835 RepID=A0A8X6LEH7_TRICU|nr:c2H2-type domain-containing protein [Trichonephila clavata]